MHLIHHRVLLWNFKIITTSSEIKTSTTEVLSTTVYQSSLLQSKDKNTIANDKHDVTMKSVRDINLQK